MSTVVTVIAILLINLVISQTDYESQSEVKTLGIGNLKSVFALQITQIRTTSEKTLAAFTGNNLNDVSPIVLDEQNEHFRAISPTYPNEKTTNDEKIKNDQNGSGLKLLSSLIGNYPERSKLKGGENINHVTEPSSLFWDNCFSKAYKVDENLSSRRLTAFEDSNLIVHNNNDNLLSKRESEKNNTAFKKWLSDFQSNRNRHDLDMINEIMPFSTTTDLSIFQKNVVPITEDIFESKVNPFNFSLNTLVTKNSIQISNVNGFDKEDESKIKFSSLPQTQTYLIPKLKLEEGFHPFSFMSTFFGVIYPFEYPVGVVRDIVRDKFTFPYSFLQSVKLESTFLVVVVTFGCLALIIPIYLLILCLMALVSKSKCAEENESGALFLESETPDCYDKLFVVLTFLVVLVCCTLILGMVFSNEQSRTAVAESQNIVNCACSDLSTWISTTAHELHDSLVEPMDIVLYAYKEDLRNVEHLLGEPIQHAISSESGIDLVLDSLADIITESEDLSTKVSSLRDICMKAGLLASAASERIKDVAQQLDNLKKHCNPKDLPLCDTLNTNSMQLMMQFDSILREQELLELRTLGVHNLTQEIAIARKEFRTLPSEISSQTERVRADIVHDIELQKQMVHSSARVLGDVVRHLTADLRTVSRQIGSMLERLEKYEFWRWTVILGINGAVGVIVLLILLAMLCGCGNAKKIAARTLQVSSFWLCFVSIILWLLVSAVFLVSGHAEVFACQILWDKPQYKALVTLLDKPSPLLPEDDGIFDALFKNINNVTINVSVRDVLRECERNQPAYNVFQLEKILDVNKETSYFEWVELQNDLKRLSSAIDVRFLKTISVNFNKLLNRIHVVSDVNLTKYRMEYNGPVVGKDLPSFVDQIENVAVQVTDLSTAGRLESLATRTQRLHLTNIKPLEQLRTELVYKLTELELQITPFRRKLNISLSHIHTAQFYIDNQGDVIAEKKLSTYISRLISHTAGWRTHALTATEKHAGKCAPVFAVYAALRSLLCTNYISSLHGWWFCGFLLGFFWCTFLTPLLVHLWRSYGRKYGDIETLTLTNIAEPGTPATATCDNNWNTPEPPPPPRNDSW